MELIVLQTVKEENGGAIFEPMIRRGRRFWQSSGRRTLFLPNLLEKRTVRSRPTRSHTG